MYVSDDIKYVTHTHTLFLVHTYRHAHTHTGIQAHTCAFSPSTLHHSRLPPTSEAQSDITTWVAQIKNACTISNTLCGGHLKAAFTPRAPVKTVRGVCGEDSEGSLP